MGRAALGKSSAAMENFLDSCQKALKTALQNLIIVDTGLNASVISWVFVEIAHSH